MRRTGIAIGPGTLYPLLYGQERGLLRSELKNVTGRRRRVYEITVRKKFWTVPD